MNILEAEDLVKGMPDDYLHQQAKAPDGQVPQFLLISEIQRRTDMRKRFQNQQQEMPQGTVADQIMQGGIASVAPQGAMPPQSPPATPPPQGMAGGGIISRYAPGGQVNEYDPVEWAIQMSRAGRSRDEVLEVLATAGERDAMREMMYNYDIDPNTGAFAIPPEIDLPNMSAATLDAPPLERGLYPDDIREMNLSDQEKAFVLDNAQTSFNTPREPVKDAQIPEGIATVTTSGKQYIGPGHGIASVGELGQRLITETDNPIMDLYDVAEPGITELVDTTAEFGDAVKRAHKAGMFSDMWGDASRAIYSEGSMWDSVFGVVNSLFGGSGTDEVLEDSDNPVGDQLGIPPAADGKPEGTKNPQQQGLTSAQTQGTGANAGSPKRPPSTEPAEDDYLGRLAALMTREKDTFPDMSDLTEDAKRQAWSNAIIQLGAGIASDADDLGLGKAGAVMAAGRKDARDLEAKGRMAKYAASQKEVDRDIEILGKAAGIDMARYRAEIQERIQGGENINSIMRFAGGIAESLAQGDYDSASKAMTIRKALSYLLSPAALAQINLEGFGKAFGPTDRQIAESYITPGG